MIRIVTLIIMGLMFCNLGFSQTEINGFTGICELKLGVTTTSYITNLIRTKKRKLALAKNTYSIKSESLRSTIFEIQIDTVEFTVNAPKISNHKKYIIGNIKLCNEYEEDKLELDFFNDTLYSVDFERGSFEVDFTKKYGRPTYETRISQHKCDLSTGDDITFDDETLILNWDNDSIHACRIYSKNRDRKTCNVTTESQFSMFNRKISRIVMNLEDAAYSEIEARRERKLEIKLKKL